MPLTPLADDAVDQELGKADPFELPPDFPLLIHRLTGGLPQGVRALAQAVTSALPAHPPPGGQMSAGPLRAAGLLDLRAGPSDAAGRSGDSGSGSGDSGSGPATAGADAATPRAGLATLQADPATARARQVTGPAARGRGGAAGRPGPRSRRCCLSG